MAITDVSQEYEDNLTAWEADRDFVKGDIAVKAGGQTYLPKIIADQTDAEYAAYLARGLYPGAVGRTVNGLTGSALLKEPEINLNGRMLDLITTERVKGTIKEDITYGRTGILVDMPVQTDPPSVLNVITTTYDVFQIRKIKKDKAGNMIQVVLKESRDGVDEDGKDIIVVVYRELMLIDGVYTVRLWEEVIHDDKLDWEIVEILIPTARDKSLRFIPFIVINPQAVSTKVEVSPIQDMVAVAISQYQTIADWKHGLKFTALPTLAATGVDSEEGPNIKLGSGTALVSVNEGAKFYFVEFDGKGLVEIVTAISIFTDWMVYLGARLFQDPKKGVESEETTRLKQGAEGATLSSIVDAVESGYRLVIEYANLFLGTNVDPESAFSMSRDFIDSKMPPEELTAIMNDWVNGGMSFETYYYLKHQGEKTRPGITAEDEQNQIEQDMPAFNEAEPE